MERFLNIEQRLPLVFTDLLMKTVILLIFFFTAFNGCIFSQSQESDSVITSKKRTREDTLRALKKFNIRFHRKNRNVILISAATTIALIFISRNNTNDGKNSGYEFLVGGSAGILGSSLFSFFKSKRYFKRITNGYKQGKQLPSDIRSRLLEKDFER